MNETHSNFVISTSNSVPENNKSWTKLNFAVVFFIFPFFAYKFFCLKQLEPRVLVKKSKWNEIDCSFPFFHLRYLFMVENKRISLFNEKSFFTINKKALITLTSSISFNKSLIFQKQYLIKWMNLNNAKHISAIFLTKQNKKKIYYQYGSDVNCVEKQIV